MMMESYLYGAGEAGFVNYYVSFLLFIIFYAFLFCFVNLVLTLKRFDEICSITYTILEWDSVSFKNSVYGTIKLYGNSRNGKV